jgi:fatty-acyl-CoA synthase
VATTAELIGRGARQHGSRPAILFGDERLTFAEVDDLASRIAGVLRARRLERVGLLVDNCLWSVPLDFACAKAGIARVPLNSRLGAAEQREILRVAGAGVLVSDRPTDLPVEVIPLEGLLELARAASPDDPGLEHAADDPLLLIATSGTTGRVKLVQHTQGSYAAIVANILANLLDPQRDDVMLHAASLIHASGTFVIPFWLRGGASAVLSSFVPHEFVAAIARHRVTHTNVVPTMLGALLDVPGDGVDVSSLRCVVYGASPMPVALLERALARWGPIFIQYYGQTEAPLCIAVLRPEDHHGSRLLSCGQPAVEAEVRLDPETGEILVRAPFAAAGYVGDEELHRATFLQDGWVRTRDVGRFDAEGYLYLVDRTSDMIVTGGYNVYPREVENALALHAGVRECVVVGAPDEKWVEAVTAFVVADGVGEVELIEHCRGLLAGYKVPKSVRFVDEIPKSPVGKLLRRAVRDPLWEGHERPI